MGQWRWQPADGAGQKRQRDEGSRCGAPRVRSHRDPNDDFYDPDLDDIPEDIDKEGLVEVALVQRIQMWMIRKLEGPHTCMSAHMSQDHRKLDEKTICNCIIPLVKESPTIQVSVLIADMQARFKYNVLYRKVDGTWLYGKYTQVLLITVAQDGNRNVLSIAFAIMESHELKLRRFRQRFTRLESKMSSLPTDLRTWLGSMENWQWTQSYDEGFRLATLMPRMGSRQAKQIKARHVVCESKLKC
ncbi:hypothetical protein GOBAR_DD15826 [Gossypium barbadense]|nr:hypothetical protein GOBAR_DD15826 [Gossypium barbadense]